MCPTHGSQRYWESSLPTYARISKTGAPGDRPEADRNIEAVPLPALDPLYGPEGPMLEHWSSPGEE